MSANESQVGGTHYTDMSVQPWEAMRAWMTPEQFAGYLLGNVIKYAARHPAKGSTEDLRKARHYLSKLIEFRLQGDVAARRKRALGAVRENTTGLGVAIDNGTAPAVSESAVGDAEWPGPDWSQAPEWAVAYAIDAITSPSTKSKAHWYGRAPHTSGAASVWYFAFSSGRCVFEAAPDFGYTGDWRDSLRFRPSLGEADGQ